VAYKQCGRERKDEWEEGASENRVILCSAINNEGRPDLWIGWEGNNTGVEVFGAAPAFDTVW